MTDLSGATVFLFVPGDVPHRFERAADSGADVVIIDLEDGVSPERRPEARRNAATWLRSGKPALVRISAHGTEDHDRDVAALRGLTRQLMLAKTESPEEADATAAAFGGPAEVVALIETARGVVESARIAAAGPVVRLAFGNIDLANELGVDPADHEALLVPRSLVNLASSAAGIAPPIDGVTTRVGDEELVRTEARLAESLGFRAKLCIHPAQVPGARAGLAPTDSQISWAHRILAAATDGAARTVDGAMVDRPVEAKARNILRRVSAGESP